MQREFWKSETEQASRGRHRAVKVVTHLQLSLDQPRIPALTGRLDPVKLSGQVVTCANRSATLGHTRTHILDSRVRASSGVSACSRGVKLAMVMSMRYFAGARGRNAQSPVARSSNVQLLPLWTTPNGKRQVPGEISYLSCPSCFDPFTVQRRRPTQARLRARHPP
jgi:hypothetical protein